MTRIKSDPEHLDSAQRGGACMGGGRRKQSKPIRVFMDIDADTPAATPAEDIPDGLHDNQSLIDSAGRAEGDIDNMDLDTAIATNDDGDNDVARQSDESRHSSNDNNANVESFPTKYHQLGSVFQETSMGLNRSNSLNNDNPMDVTPSDNKNMDKNSDGASSSGEGRSRIFHQDAYCDLCDREFCNKYFLKTHKANMHSIFEDDSDSQQQTPLAMPMPVMPNLSMPVMPGVPGGLSMPGLPPNIPMPGAVPIQMPKSGSPNSVQSNGHDKSPTGAKPEISKPQPIWPVSTNAQRPTPNPPAPMKSIANAPLKNIPATPPKTVLTPSKQSSAAKPGHDMEDYCEICQKHFCNKYYLKKHKQDVHGIVPEPSPASAGKRGRPPMANQMGNPPISMPSSLSASLNSLIMPPVMSSASSMNGPQAGLPGLGNVMLLNPFAPPMLIQGLQQPPVLPPGFTSQGMTMPPLQTPVTSESKLSESPKTTPSVAAINTENMPGLGVLNAEAYCEICRKEFCNKYFLRVHKATKHGIFLDEDMMPTTGPQSDLPVLNVPAPGSDLPPGTINIIPKDPDSLLKLPKELKDERDDESKVVKDDNSLQQSDTSNEECHLCKKQFVNKYNLKVHMINAHGLTFPDFDLSPPRDNNKNRSDKQQPIQSTMFGNMIAAKLADRVMCDICNKEVCNKYFLKTHKIKVHGIDPSQLEVEAVTSPQKKSVQPTKLNPNVMMPSEMKAFLNMEPPHMLIKPPEMKNSDSNLSNGTDPNAPRPKDEELLKMGIDPEAYCELCKKEFCSKYFLKTHKQNIHGIKMDPALLLSSQTKGDPTTPDAMNGLSLMARPDFGAMAMAALSRGEPLFPLNLMNNNNKVNTSASGNTSPSSQADSDASGPWKWRDSPNAQHQKITCELCNKDMCNKYFLRTHLLSKHGLHWDLVGPISSAQPVMPFGIPGALPPHLASLERGPMDMPLNLLPPGMLPRLPDEVQPLDLKKTYNGDGGKKDDEKSVWHMPAQHKSGHGGEAGIGFKKCEICGAFFGDKVTLQLHMIQDHPGEVIVSAKGKSDERRPIGSNIGLSLRKKYQKGRRIRGHFRRLFNTSSSGVGIGNGIKSALVNYVKNQQQQKKKYRCAYCQDRFTSRSDCQLHIRNSHPSAKSKHKSIDNVIPTSQSSQTTRSHSNKENAHPISPSETTENMDVSVGQASPLPNGIDNNRELVMQSFYLEGQGSFAPAKLVLPVYQKFDEPVSVTFTLKPSQ